MAKNAKQARKEWEAKQSEPKPEPAHVVRKRRPRESTETRRENALHRHAQLVYDHDRDFDGEFS
jgi:hypothetical protein